MLLTPSIILFPVCTVLVLHHLLHECAVLPATMSAVVLLHAAQLCGSGCGCSMQQRGCGVMCSGKERKRVLRCVFFQAQPCESLRSTARASDLQ